MGDAGEHAAADRLLLGGGGRGLLMQARREARQPTDREHRQLEQHRCAEQQDHRRDMACQTGRQRRTDDRADCRAGGDEAEQPLALLRAE